MDCDSHPLAGGRDKRHLARFKLGGLNRHKTLGNFDDALDVIDGSRAFRGKLDGRRDALASQHIGLAGGLDALGKITTNVFQSQATGLAATRREPPFSGTASVA